MTHTMNRRTISRSFLAVAMMATLAACGGGGGEAAPAPAPQQPRATASWTAAMQDYTQALPGRPALAAPTFNDQTLRQVVRMSLGGDTLRVKLSNLFGTSAVTFTSVHVARSAAVTSDIDPATDRAVTFGGQSSITVAAGTEVHSDPISLAVAPLSNLAVSMYFAGPTMLNTVHMDSRQTSYIVTGNRVTAMSTGAPIGDQRETWYGLAAVEVAASDAPKVLVAFGDSLVDGRSSTVNTNKRFPSLLDERLKAAGQARTSVVNTGIAGNRWLNDFSGPNGAGRFDRDVLQIAGVTHVLMLMGINDIGFSVEPLPSQAVTAEQIIGAVRTAVTSANARGIKVLLGTLLPYRPAGYYSTEGEAKRQAVNAWIRANQDVAAVVDFDMALRDPADPTRLNPAYDSGDHLHPNDAGYKAMADAVDLSKL